MTRRILAILFALALAVFGTAAVLLYVKSADDRAVTGMEPVDVLVAKARIPAGTTGEVIRSKELAETIKLPARSVPADEVLTRIPAELDKLVITSDLQPRQVVLKGMFSQQTRTAGGLAIPEGKIAISVEATMAAQVAGYVRPGSQVAVFASYHFVADGKNTTRVLGSSGEGPGGTSVLLSKVEVIAVGPYGEGATTVTPLDNGNAGNNDTEASAAVLVTVAVTTEEAAKLIHAANADAIYLALVNDSSDVRVGAGFENRSNTG